MAWSRFTLISLELNLPRLVVMSTTPLAPFVAIECGGSSILQYGYALHFLGRDILDITLDTIYHEKWGIAIQTLHAADVEGWIDA